LIEDKNLNYQYITCNEQLSLLCDVLKQATTISLDTEFMRTRTYYPQMGLIQLYADGHLALIDPLHIDNWQCLITILRSQSLQKYFHACSEDIDVFMYQFDLIPTSILDSQVVASFLDNPICSGYATLVNKYLQVKLDKSETRTDWLARPLTDKQCHYAAADVYYLHPLMDTLIEHVTAKGWFTAAREECQTLLRKKQDIIQPENAYQYIKKASQLKGVALNQLQRLAKWRLEYARSHNIAVNFVLHEELLWKIARYQPTSLAELTALGMHGREIRLYGEIIVNMLKQPILQPLAELVRTVDYPNYKKIAQHLKMAADNIARDTGLNQELILSRRHINQYVEWLADPTQQPLPEIVSGWRKPLFADYLSA
jgi:ribonuclease D